MALQCLGQQGVAGAGLGKYDVQDLLAGPGLGDAFDELCLGGARPGPGADGGEAAFVDVHDDQPAFVLPAGGLAPGPVAGAFLQGLQPGLAEPEGWQQGEQRGGQCGSGHPEGGAAVVLWLGGGPPLLRGAGWRRQSQRLQRVMPVRVPAGRVLSKL
ncbi:hypothetical protein MASR1M59_13470 [Melaminivora sp.]